MINDFRTVGGWSGEMVNTSPVASTGSFVAAGDVATIVLKSGSVGHATTGTAFDDLVVSASTPGNWIPSGNDDSALRAFSPRTGACS